MPMFLEEKLGFWLWMVWTESSTSSESLCLLCKFNFQPTFYPSYTGSPACWLAEGTCRGVLGKSNKQHNSWLLQHLCLWHLDTAWAQCCPDQHALIWGNSQLFCIHLTPTTRLIHCTKESKYEQFKSWSTFCVIFFFLNWQLISQTSLKTELCFTPRLNRSVCSSGLTSSTRNNHHHL